MFTIVPGWMVYAALKETPEGVSAPAIPAVVKLRVADSDLEVILRVLKLNGYDRIEAEREAFSPIGNFEVKQEVLDD